MALAEGKKVTAQANLAYAQYRERAAETLRSETFGTVLQADQWTAQARMDASAVNQADSEIKRAVVKLQSDIGGVNTRVAAVEAQLQQARYYLDNTTLVAPEDGRIVNLQVRREWCPAPIALAASRHSSWTVTDMSWRRTTKRT